MKKRYRRRQKIEIFRDYHNQDKSLGVVRLIEYLRPGYTFNTEDKDKDGELLIYCYERWIVEFLESKYYPKGHKKQHNIRFNLRDLIKDKDFIANYPSELSMTVTDEDRPFDNEYYEN